MIGLICYCSPWSLGFAAWRCLGLLGFGIFLLWYTDVTINSVGWVSLGCISLI